MRIGVADAVPGSGVNPLGGTEAMTLDTTPVTPQWVGEELHFTPAAALSEGPHTVEASVRDRAGNPGALGPYTFSVDVTPPGAATITNPMGLQPVRGSIPLTAGAEDGGTPGVRSEVAEILGDRDLCWWNGCVADDFFFPGYMAKAGGRYWREGTLATGAPTCDFCYEEKDVE